MGAFGGLQLRLSVVVVRSVYDILWRVRGGCKTEKGFGKRIYHYDYEGNAVSLLFRKNSFYRPKTVEKDFTVEHDSDLS